MTKLRYLIVLIMVAYSLLIMSQNSSPELKRINDVSFVIQDGLSNNSLKSKIEGRISMLLSEMTWACNTNRNLQLNNIGLSHNCEKSLIMLWDNFHISCDCEENYERCLQDVNGYEIRGIPVTLHPTSADYHGETSKELTISFSSDGTITGVHMALSNNVYEAVMSKGREVTDTRRRLEILKFVEDFRSYYDEKDLASLHQIFSDDALIITGRVIMKKEGGDNASLKPEIVYSRQNKEQYLKSLSNVFSRNKYIKVSFDNIKVVRHGAKAGFYGVTLHQKWESSNYSDDGYVFLLWEFQDGQHPVIHVRTWQPEKFGGRTLDESEVFNINDFFIP